MNKESPSVVIVDDNSIMRSVLRSILREAGYRVVGEAANGESALRLVIQERPQVVCLDIQMPTTDGLEVLRQIKERNPRTVVLMITGNAERATVETAAAGGADGYIVKPFNVGKVLDTLAQALSSPPRAPAPAPGSGG